MVKNITTQQLEKIQLDEGIIFINYGLVTERLLGPTRGGGEFSANAKIREIECDGSNGSVQGLQSIEEQDASLKVTVISLSQENMALTMPGARTTGSGEDTVVKNPLCGIISDESYIENVTMFTKLADNRYKKITINRAINDGKLSVKAAPKSEGEVPYEFKATYGKDDLNGDLWEIREVTMYGAPVFVSAITATNGLKVLVTFSHEMNSATITAANFTVNMSDTSKTISAAAINATDAHIVELTVSTAITAGKTVTVAYTKGTAKDTSGQSLESFTAQPVVNATV